MKLLKLQLTDSLQTLDNDVATQSTDILNLQTSVNDNSVSITTLQTSLTSTTETATTNSTSIQTNVGNITSNTTEINGIKTTLGDFDIDSSYGTTVVGVLNQVSDKVEELDENYVKFNIEHSRIDYLRVIPTSNTNTSVRGFFTVINGFINVEISEFNNSLLKISQQLLPGINEGLNCFMFHVKSSGLESFISINSMQQNTHGVQMMIIFSFYL